MAGSVTADVTVGPLKMLDTLTDALAPDAPARTEAPVPAMLPTLMPADARLLTATPVLLVCCVMTMPLIVRGAHASVLTNEPDVEETAPAAVADTEAACPVKSPT